MHHWLLQHYLSFFDSEVFSIVSITLHNCGGKSLFRVYKLIREVGKKTGLRVDVENSRNTLSKCFHRCGLEQNKKYLQPSKKYVCNIRYLASLLFAAVNSLQVVLDTKSITVETLKHVILS